MWLALVQPVCKSNDRFHPVYGTQATSQTLLIIFIIIFFPCFAHSGSFFKEVYEDLGTISTSPARIDLQTVPYIVVGGAGLYYFINNDVTLYNDVKNNHADLLDKTMSTVTLLGDGLVHLGSYGLLLKFGNERDKEIASVSIRGLIAAGVVSVVAKSIFSATRPSEDDTNHQFFKYLKIDGSFPSGHTIVAFTGAVILGRSYHIEYITYPIATLVAFSRVYLESHWPSDVLAGALLGIWVGNEVFESHRKDIERKFEIIPSFGENRSSLTFIYYF